ncbi:hypothetical protein OG339_47865 (plasmid) [Streptosporangium sp. NBC_01495]|uniref:hypothetical protein n=1 Tax=Streptosporangium sp. NBC_01495 TaxID=2903899 RepID=UPI002E2F660D|nr:hypothetical protein [Streptosporangium sp. NBC_01495]
MTMMTVPVPLEALCDILKIPLKELNGSFTQMDWAEEEIANAMRRHPTEADTLFHCFVLLKPTSDRMDTEFVYRSHCRELLNRAAAGEDTRPGTAVEVCCACSDSNKLGPFTSPAAGLYMRVWAQAFPDKPMFAGRHEHHEALEGSRIDDLEKGLRGKLAVKDRRLGTIECDGRHHGEPVRCRYVGPGLGSTTRPGDFAGRQPKVAPSARRAALMIFRDRSG